MCVAVIVEYDIRQRGMLFGNVLAANVNVSVGYRVRKPRSVLMVPNNFCLIAALPGQSINVAVGAAPPVHPIISGQKLLCSTFEILC